MQSQLDQKKNSSYFKDMHHQNLTNNTQNKPADLTDLFNHLTDGIICINQEGIVTTFNSAAEKMLGIESSTVTNSLFEKSFNDTFFGFSVQKSLKEQKISKSINPYINIKNTNNNTLHDLKINPQINPHSLTIIIQDLSELNEAEKNIHTSNRMKDLGKMTALLAHEIRNPLGGIKGFASLLRRDLEKEPQLRQMAEMIIDGTDHLNSLVTHILNFAHPLQMQFQPVDIIKIVYDLKKMIEVDERLKQKILLNKIIFKIQSPDTKLIVPVDEELIRSCLLNLFVNAIDAMPQGGFLTVSVEEDENYAMIQVSDTGIGIPKENLKKIFSAFFTTKTEGNGFGLLEVYKVVSAHRGTINVDSTVGLGTTFTIKIPKNF